MPRRTLSLVLAALVAVTGGGCVLGRSAKEDRAKQKVPMAPAFPPETDEATGDLPGTAATTPGGGPAGTTARPGGPTSSVPGGSGSATVPGSGGASGGALPGGAPIVTTSSSFTDPSGDTTAALLGEPPAWADLVGGRLTRSADGFELRVLLRGGAPENSGSDEHTMNVASFYDVDGDGTIDVEVWANAASGGWGTSHFDNDRKGVGGFGDQSGVTVGVEGGDLVMRFPLAHLRNVERFRWSLASEWGRYETIGTAAAVRDDAPDGDAPARFPGA